MSSTKSKKPRVSLAVIDTPRARKIIYLLGIVLLVAIVLLKVKPNLDEEKALQAATVQVQADRQAKEQELRTLQASRSAKGNRAQQLSKVILTSLPTDVQNDAVLGDLNRLAGATGVQLGNFQPSAPADGGSFRKVGITLTLSGGYENLLRFMRGLTSQTIVNDRKSTIAAVGPIWSLESVALTPGAADAAGGGSPSGMSLNLAATLYLSPLTNTAPAGAAPAGAAPASGTPATPPAP